ncbi:MAG: Phospholipase D precursor [candidate division TA06 bacterium ADurb.Bin131]|uniref:phospholipase D n=1 Tax=candidate division TA06 bacterium ADurb.Bin131 TaxID=1852827 RepID=A0A1V6C4G1_UNCT6|nr:MAG: Phospholipase D precursor [candidate division TA06 bacterium ADurb.Bin131]HOC02967.1 phospholipase D-like domain-containing protein [bacterium]HQL64483.1 phospholipase D-like domain-containing protein [bacterium]
MIKNYKIVYLFSFLFILNTTHLLCTPADVEPINNCYYLPKIVELISNAETSIKIVMYNVVWYSKYPDSASNRIINKLCEAAKRKVNVTVILNQDKFGNKITNESKEAGEILRKSGVNVLYDSLDQTTHAKLMIVDDRFVVIGSFNWSYYSIEKNNEVAVVIDSKEIAQQYLKYFASIAVRSSPEPASP